MQSTRKLRVDYCVLMCCQLMPEQKTMWKNRCDKMDTDSDATAVSEGAPIFICPVRPVSVPNQVSSGRSGSPKQAQGAPRTVLLVKQSLLLYPPLFEPR